MYNIWNAAAYEITNILIEYKRSLELNPLIKAIRLHCFPDWVAWKTERTMKNVDKQIAQLQKEMQIEHDEKYVTPIIREHKPDQSNAQQLLGGTLQITAPWYKPETKNWLRVHCMNLYTVTVKAMKMRQCPADQKQEKFIEALRDVQFKITNLLEDPLFIDSIHGEQEMGLDLALDLIDNILARIDIKDTQPQANLMDQLERTAVDITWDT